jgi:hypothetical protein
MSDKKQSSVDWLISQLDKYYVLSFDDLKNNEAVQQAKAMHEQEVQTAYWEGGQDVPMTSKRCEEYYNETFNSDEA